MVGIPGDMQDQLDFPNVWMEKGAVVADVGHMQGGYEHGSEGHAEEVNVKERETHRRSADVNLEWGTVTRKVPRLSS